MATVYNIRSNKSQEEDSPISKHITEWQRLSIEQRDLALGQGYLQDIQDFYMLATSGAPTPQFRPQIRIPELQTLMLYEANDLSETAPRVYITDTDSGDRDEEREKVVQSEWRRTQVNYHAMFSMLDSLFCGLGCLQLGINPDARGGRGGLWVKRRRPDTFYPDPTTDYDLEWSYIIFEDYMHLDEIRKRWPLTSIGLKPKPTTSPKYSLMGPAGSGLQMPPGPMQSVGGLPSNKITPSDTRLRVRYCYCLDYTRILAKTEKGELPPGALVQPEYEWKYPNGRLITECEGRVLADGDNWAPLGLFPCTPFWSMPPLYGIWSVPAVRYSVTLQNVAERGITSIFENNVRLNNGVWFIHSNTGLDAEAFGGIPGEVCIINPNSPVPQCVTPPAFGKQHIEFPQWLLERQKILQGFTQSRSGNPGAGNISTELFDESVLRSQGMTQLRGRLAAISFQRFAELFFYTMCRFYTSSFKRFYPGDAGEDESIHWQPLDRLMQGRPSDAYELEVDPASIQPLSQAIIRKMVPELMKSQIIQPGRGLELLNFPHAKEIGKEYEQSLSLQALARAKGTRR